MMERYQNLEGENAIYGFTMYYRGLPHSLEKRAFLALFLSFFSPCKIAFYAQFYFKELQIFIECVCKTYSFLRKCHITMA